MSAFDPKQTFRQTRSASLPIKRKSVIIPFFHNEYLGGINLFQKILYLCLLSLILSLFGCQLNDPDEVKDDRKSFCPFGICKGSDPNELFDNEVIRSVHLDVYSATNVIPPQPFIEGETFIGDMFEGIQYSVLHSEQTGVCATGLLASIKKENLERFYQKVNNYLSVKLKETALIEQGEEPDNLTIYTLSGENISHLNEINEVIHTISDNTIFGDYSISFEFWFNNVDECISYAPEIGKLRTHTNIN